jgi:hypothetical protein
MEATMSEPNDNVDIARLRRLAHEMCDGLLAEEGINELSLLLAASQRAAEEYWQIVGIHEQLHWDLAEEVGRPLATTQSYGAAAESKAFGAVQFRSTSLAPRHYFVVAACLLVSALGGLMAWRHFEDRRDSQVAHNPAESRTDDTTALGSITALVPQSKWSVGRPGGNNIASLRQGDTIYLEDGAAELRLVTNTVAVLESPLVMQVLSVDRVRVISGNIKVEVAKGTEGFSVETASAEVIDLGTEFAVNVADGNTDVVVYDGEVDLKLTGTDVSNDAERVTKRFRAGEAVHVSDDGTLSRIVNVTRTNFALVEQRQPLISAVKDNVARSEIWNFYEIVPGGMGEDQQAYVDRPHEWNGATPEGIPGYLGGGDYVKTFCNDKITKDLHVEVTLSRPAILFVLFDKRAVPPDWLTQSFEATGDDIGIDETIFDVWKQKTYGEDHLEVGPGNGIERRFSIWRKVVTEPGVVSLGPNGAPISETKSLDLNAKMAMYGIVAIPWEQKEATAR